MLMYTVQIQNLNMLLRQGELSSPGWLLSDVSLEDPLINQHGLDAVDQHCALAVRTAWSMLSQFVTRRVVSSQRKVSKHMQ